MPLWENFSKARAGVIHPLFFLKRGCRSELQSLNVITFLGKQLEEGPVHFSGEQSRSKKPYQLKKFTKLVLQYMIRKSNDGRKRDCGGNVASGRNCVGD